MKKHASSTTSQKTLHVPGIGTVSVGPHAVPSVPGESSIEKILKSIKRAQKEKIFPPLDHATA